ncbi:MAG: ATP-dependent zinc protease [Gammaproteobacteria bacterium]
MSIIPSSLFAETDREPITTGWLERVIFAPWDIKFRAKLDTGAKTSSLHAVEIKRFKRDDKEWVRFSTTDPEDKSNLKPIEVPLVREVKIKRHKEAAQVRPVVELTFCLDGHVYTSEFSLIDRSRFNYQVLLGRRMLQQGIIVDPSTTFTTKINPEKCRKLLQIHENNKVKNLTNKKEKMEGKP